MGPTLVLAGALRTWKRYAVWASRATKASTCPAGVPLTCKLRERSQIQHAFLIRCTRQHAPQDDPPKPSSSPSTILHSTGDDADDVHDDASDARTAKGCKCDFEGAMERDVLPARICRAIGAQLDPNHTHHHWMHRSHKTSAPGPKPPQASSLLTIHAVPGPSLP